MIDKSHIAGLQWSWSITQRTLIALTCKVEAARSRRIGGTMVTFFLWDWCCVWWFALRHARVSERREVLGCWSLCLQLTYQHKGINIFVTKCPETSSFAICFYDFWASCLIFFRSWDLHTKEWVCMLFCLPGYNENRKNVYTCDIKASVTQTLTCPDFWNGKK